MSALQTLPCNDSDTKVLTEELKIIRRSLIFMVTAILLIAFIVPLLGSSKTHGKAIVDYMPYYKAVVSIILVLSIIPVFYWFTSAPKVLKDLREKIKLLAHTKITKKEIYRFKKIKGNYIKLELAEFSSKGIAVTPLEFEELKEGDAVIIEFFPHSKKVIRLEEVYSKSAK